MRKGNPDPNTTIIPTEYGPLVLKRAVAFAGDEDEAERSRRRDEAAEAARRRAADRAA